MAWYPYLGTVTRVTPTGYIARYTDGTYAGMKSSVREAERLVEQNIGRLLTWVRDARQDGIEAYVVLNPAPAPDIGHVAERQRFQDEVIVGTVS